MRLALRVAARVPSASASPFSASTALIFGPASSYAAMRARYSSTSRSEVSAPASNAALMSAMLAAVRSKTFGVSSPSAATAPRLAAATMTVARIVCSNAGHATSFSTRTIRRAAAASRRGSVPMARPRLVAARELEQRRLGERPAEKLERERCAFGRVAHRHEQPRQPRHRAQIVVGVRDAIAGAHRGVDRVRFVLVAAVEKLGGQGLVREHDGIELRTRRSARRLLRATPCGRAAALDTRGRCPAHSRSTPRTTASPASALSRPCRARSRTATWARSRLKYLSSTVSASQ